MSGKTSTVGYSKPSSRARVMASVVGKPQCPDSSTAKRQVVGVQVLQGVARLDDRFLRLVSEERQRGPDRGNLSNQVAGLVIKVGILHDFFSRLQFLFDAGGPSSH